jgi:dienelactone hydrolase
VSEMSMLGSYGAWAAGLAGDRPGALSLRNGTWYDLATWRVAARQGAAALLRSPGPAAATDARTHKAYTADGVTVEELSWQLPWGPRTGAFYLKPSGVHRRLPGVLALHDHGGNKYFGKRKITRVPGRMHPALLRHQDDYYGGRGWANELARRGYAVLVHDVFAFESRAIAASELPRYVVERMMSAPGQVRELLPGDLAAAGGEWAVDVPADEPQEAIDRYNAFAAAHESIIAKSLFCAGTTWPGVVLAEDRAALDWLASRDDVDPDRLACCGLSGGGLRSDYLAGMDHRVRCAVSVGMMTTWRDFLLHTSHTHTWMIYVPGLPPLLDFPEILGMRAPLPTLVQSTTEDPLFTRAETGRAADMLRDVWKRAGSPDSLRFSWHEGPHRFDLAMQEEAFAWLEQWLR